MSKKNKRKELPSTMGKPAINIPYNVISENPPLLPSQIIKQKITSGPLPDADTLEHYNRINPEIVKTILTMAETEQQKAITQEQHSFQIQHKAINSVNLGRILGAMCFISIVCLAGYALYTDKEWIAKFLLQSLLTLGLICSAGIGYIIYKRK
ncbi:DUF2335 domain-containing protein [bacterium]|nr:DUF2335 domain-containing protein [bacterium]